jgi:hypothetical protein
MSKFYPDELNRRGVNTGKNGMTRIVFFSGRVIRFSNVNIEALDVL